MNFWSKGLVLLQQDINALIEPSDTVAKSDFYAMASRFQLTAFHLYRRITLPLNKPLSILELKHHFGIQRLSLDHLMKGLKNIKFLLLLTKSPTITFYRRPGSGGS